MTTAVFEHDPQRRAFIKALKHAMPLGCHVVAGPGVANHRTWRPGDIVMYVDMISRNNREFATFGPTSTVKFDVLHGIVLHVDDKEVINYNRYPELTVMWQNADALQRQGVVLNDAQVQTSKRVIEKICIRNFNDMVIVRLRW